MSFFVDAAHFVMQPFLGFLWCFVRQFIQAPSGRKRFNVLGALHATSLQLVTVTNDTYINAYSVAKLLCKLAVDFRDLPITLVMDNADAHMKRQIMGREVVVAITNGKLDFGTWEQIFYGEFDGRRRKL